MLEIRILLDTRTLIVVLLMGVFAGSASGYIVGQYQIAEYQDEIQRLSPGHREMLDKYIKFRDLSLALKYQLNEIEGEYQAL